MSVFKISASKNLDFINSIDEWRKWRVAYEGGRLFIQTFLNKFGRRETQDDFDERKRMAYNPAFAEAGINDFKNAIYQRMSDIKRIGGSDDYQNAIKGKSGGVDGYGCSMNTFMGQKVLPELLPIGKVGVMVDKSPEKGAYKQTGKKKPYLYYYCAEDIWNWAYIMGDDGEQIFYNLLLRVTEYGYDDTTGLPLGTKEYIRHFWLRDDKKVVVTDYTESPPDRNVEVADVQARQMVLDIPRIPFVMMSLTSGLMKNIADYQIGLLNLSSSDLNYVLKGNFPFYTEQFDSAVENPYRKPDGKDTGTAVASKTSGTQEAGVGTVSGRRYPKGLERPGFIAPPAEPLLASMKKQDQMKEDIRQLLSLGLANTKSTHASADSKSMDDRSMEAGLSSIGQELEWGEREIGKIWAMYEAKESTAQINYPVKYELKSQKDREDSAKSLKELKNAVPSKTFGKEIGKRIGRVMLEGTVDDSILDKIDKEIDSANYITSDAVEITADITNGLVSPETASTARGYDGAIEVPKAQEAQAKRLAVIATSQTQGAGAARGIPDATPAPGAAKDEKIVSQNQDTNPGSKTRGPGK